MRFHGERFNAASHLLGLGVALSGTWWLQTAMTDRVDAATAFGATLFAGSAILLYLCSTAFHGTQGLLRATLERWDHGTIFLLIAGTYSAFALAAPRNDLSLVVLAAIWAAALASFIRQLRTQRPPGLGVYVVLGWAAVGAAAPVAIRISTPSFGFLILGAAIYSVGTVFYRNRSGWPHAHGVWHLFVVGGTASHFAAVMYLVGEASG